MYAAECHFHKRRLCTAQNATSINGDYVDFLTTHISLVHVITPDDLIGTMSNAIITYAEYDFEILVNTV